MLLGGSHLWQTKPIRRPRSSRPDADGSITAQTAGQPGTVSFSFTSGVFNAPVTASGGYSTAKPEGINSSDVRLCDPGTLADFPGRIQERRAIQSGSLHQIGFRIGSKP